MWKVPYKALLISLLSSRHIPEEKTKQAEEQETGSPELYGLLTKVGYQGVMK